MENKGFRVFNKGDIVRHFKGKYYKVLAIAVHTETRELFVIYEALYGEGKDYVRPQDMFASPVDRKKYPCADQEYRFEVVGNDPRG